VNHSGEKIMPYDSQLHSAVFAGDSRQIIYYLELGADINSIIKDGLTPLMIACKRKKPHIVLTLLNRGANVHLKTWNKSTAFLTASLYPNAEIIALLKEKGGKFAARLHELAHDGNIKELEGEAKKGVPIDVLDDHGNTPLLLATANGQLKTVQWLRDNGASLTAKNIYGHTALLLAAANGQLEAIQWLLEKRRASLAEKDQYGQTALLIAAAHGQLETVQWLLDNGASLAEKDRYGQTALLIAAANGQLETVQWLLDNGASLAEKDEYGRTALLIAAANAHPETIQLLMKNGAAIGQSIGVRIAPVIPHTVVIGCMIPGVRGVRAVTRQTPGFENAITTLEELNACKDYIDNHEALIRACRQHLAATPYQWEISHLWKKLILLWGDVLI
jgi:ankyrin repeat protein